MYIFIILTKYQTKGHLCNVKRKHLDKGTCKYFVMLLPLFLSSLMLPVFRECADIMTGGSRRCIVVSTLAEASFYADNGYDDILYAYPLPFDKVERCAELSEKLSLFHVVVDNRLALQELKRRPLKQGKVWKVWMKLDCDNGRGNNWRWSSGNVRPYVWSMVLGVLQKDWFCFLFWKRAFLIVTQLHYSLPWRFGILQGWSWWESTPTAGTHMPVRGRSKSKLLLRKPLRLCYSSWRSMLISSNTQSESLQTTLTNVSSCKILNKYYTL